MLMNRVGSESFMLNLFIRASCLLLSTILLLNNYKSQTQHLDALAPKSLDPLIIELFHKFNSYQEFQPRGSVLVKPKTDRRLAQATILNQAELSDSDLKNLKEASEKGESYYLKASVRKKQGDKQIEVKTTQTLVKSCSLYVSNLADSIVINLNPLNEFISVNLYTTEPECNGQLPSDLSRKFNTTILVDSGSIGPVPDTETYIQRIEEELRNKSKQGKEDNRSFFAKYWIYIVPAVIILMVFSGPQEQGGR